MAAAVAALELLQVAEVLAMVPQAMAAEARVRAVVQTAGTEVKEQQRHSCL